MAHIENNCRCYTAIGCKYYSKQSKPKFMLNIGCNLRFKVVDNKRDKYEEYRCLFFVVGDSGSVEMQQCFKGRLFLLLRQMA